MDRITIEGGMQDISSGTCIKFIPRTHEPNFLDIQPRYGWVHLIHAAFLCLWTVSLSLCVRVFVCVHVIFWFLFILFKNFFLHTSSCWSFLGQTGGNQILSLQTPGCMWSGVAAHELMHALGFVHEQSRSDRDNYVTIVWKNIMAGQDERPHEQCYEGFKKTFSCIFCVLTDQLHNFRKQVTNNLNSPYDYGSLMHYGRWVAL